MIFVSLGTNKWPFPRLVEAVDELAPTLDEDVFIQAGGTLEVYTPEHAEHADTVPREEYERLVEECDVFVTHGGTGSIINGLKTETPTILFPREADRGESGYDFAETAYGWEPRQGIEVVETTEALQELLREGDLEAPEYDDDANELADTVADILAERARGRPDEELTVFCPTPPGGHLTQLMQLRDVLAEYDTRVVTWDEEVAGSIDGVELVTGYHLEEFPDPGMVRDFAITKVELLKLVATHRPDVILSAGGGGLVISTAYLAKLAGADVIHIESRSRFENKSKTGEFLYPISDRFFAQHPDVADKYGEKGQYRGTLI